MTSISSINTSLYSGLAEQINYTSGHNAPSSAQTPTASSSKIAQAPVDLSNYYSNISNADLLSSVAQNVAKSADDLDNAMVSALENGMSIQDACNINAAQAAYKANCQVMKSTFEMFVD